MSRGSSSETDFLRGRGEPSTNLKNNTIWVSRKLLDHQLPRRHALHTRQLGVVLGRAAAEEAVQGIPRLLCELRQDFRLLGQKP